MAHVRVRETKKRNKGKPVLAYVVEWREQLRDDFGLPVPVNPAHPNGPKRMRSRQETYDDRDAAQARVDELNAAKHTTGTSALAQAKAAGELPFGHYAKAWLQQQDVKVASGKLKADTVAEYARELRTYVLPTLGGLAVASITVAHVEALLAAIVQQTSRQGERKPLTAGTAKHIWDVTRRVFKYALQHRAITANPCEAVDFSVSRSTGDDDGFEHNPLTAGEVAALVAAVAGNPPESYTAATLPAYPVYALMVEFMAYSGLRTAEVTGLEVGDLVLRPVPARCLGAPSRYAEPRSAKAALGFRERSRASGLVAMCRYHPGWRRNLQSTCKIRTRTATTRLRRCGPAGRTAAGTARRASGTPCRWIGRSRLRWVRSTTPSLSPPWKRSGYRRADRPPLPHPPYAACDCTTSGTPTRLCT